MDINKLKFPAFMVLKLVMLVLLKAPFGLLE